MDSRGPCAIPPEEVSGLILAAGDGHRAGEGPKAFLKLGDKVLLEHVIGLIAPFADEVIVGVPADHLERAQAYGEQPSLRFVAGGTTRQDTLGVLVRQASRRFLLIHDVARPLTRRDHLEAALDLGRDHGAVVSVRTPRPRDGVSLRDGDYYGEALPREQVILTQAPQVYRREILLEAFRQAEQQGWQEVSTATLATRAGFRVRLLESPTENLKITYPGDLERARHHLDLSERPTGAADSGSESTEW
jgi:2-C-methyl-D-erythritol 4-phosphate cytidylyltransferase